MRSALVLTTAFFAVSALAGAASAQSGATNSAGLRYLSWPGKATAAAPVPAPTPALAHNDPALRPTRMATVVDASAAVPLARIGAPSREAPRPGLTPATAFYNPVYAPSNGAPQAYVTAPVRTPTPPVQQAAPQPAPQPTPQAVAPTASAASMAMESPQAPQQVRQASPQPQQPQPQQEQAYAPAPAADPAPAPALAPEASAAIVDPMAPRRDAAIFRLQHNSGNLAPAAPGASIDAAPASTSQNADTQQIAQAAPYSQQARYYSVHRQAGRHPDAISAPQQSYLNALPVELTQVPASKDMAEPDAPPQLIRDGNGRIRAMPQSQSDETP
nr:hypothetical protein [uncultured Brevundimonas sp.]